MKEKRKGHPYNSRRYWIIFSVLAVLLLIPFRIVGYWTLTNIIYSLISIIIGIVLIRFIQRYSWKRWIVALMLICMMLPIFQISQNKFLDECQYYSSGKIIQLVFCYDNFTQTLSIMFGGIHLGIEICKSTNPCLS